MSTRLVRCLDGHIYDADAHSQCPSCASTADAALASARQTPVEAQAAASIGANWKRRLLIFSTGIVVAIAVAWAAGLFPGPIPPPPDPEPPSKPVENKMQAEKPDSPAPTPSKPAPEPSPNPAPAPAAPTPEPAPNSKPEPAPAVPTPAPEPTPKPAPEPATPSPAPTSSPQSNPSNSSPSVSELQSAFNEGEALFYKGDYRAALTALGKFIDMARSADNQTRALGYYTRARVGVQIAINEGDSCKKMLPPPPSCTAATKFEEASRDVARSLELDPNQADANFLTGLIAEKSGDIRTAIDYYTYALRANRDYGPAYNNRASIYVDLRQYDLAMADYDEAIRVEPQNAWLWANRGVLFTRFGNWKQAISDLNRALDINPNFTFARENLRKLGVRR